jgi:hypothetical protein
VLVLKPEQVVNKGYLGHICTAMRLNELEIIAWCYAIYLLLTYELIGNKYGNETPLKFCSSYELVLACAIFSKVSALLV